MTEALLSYWLTVIVIVIVNVIVIVIVFRARPDDWRCKGTATLWRTCLQLSTHYSLFTTERPACSFFIFHSSFFILIFHFSFLFLSPQPSALRLQPSDLDIRRCAGSYLKGTWVVSDRQQAYYLFVICSLFLRYFFDKKSKKYRTTIEELSKN